jgi:hypothetical protein
MGAPWEAAVGRAMVSAVSTQIAVILLIAGAALLLAEAHVPTHGVLSTDRGGVHTHEQHAIPSSAG